MDELNNLHLPEAMDSIEHIIKEVFWSGCDVYRERYLELIMAVGLKYPNETRHQTALRYIISAEISHDYIGAVTDMPLQQPQAPSHKPDGQPDLP